MSAPVKNKRRYHSQLRARQAQSTQDAVLAAALRLFVERGWSRATIAAIARDAGVSAETIYAVFGSKPAILRRLIQDAVRGDDPEIPLLRQEAPQRLAHAPTQREQIGIFANSIAAILERVAPLIAVARSAGESDPDLRPLYRDLHEGRRRSLSFAVEALASRGPLRERMSIEAATDHIFRLASPELFLLMRDVQGASPSAIIGWLEEALACLLLPEGS